MRFRKSIIVIVLFFFFNPFNSFAQVNLPDTISIDPKATYLRINNDSGTLDAMPVELSMLGIAEGDYLLLQQLGDYNNGLGSDIHEGMIGVFSSNDSLLDQSQPHRVPGAIDAGDDYVSSPTWSGGLTTDIPEDFLIDTTIVQVPDSALFIFICAHDSKYNDNSDPDNDFGVSIQITTPPIKVSENDGGNIANNCRLYQNHPNPFNPSTNFEFSIPKSEFVTLKVYNILGEEVATLVSERLAAGKYKYDWDASSLASGVYMYRIEVGDYVDSKKMVLLR